MIEEVRNGLIPVIREMHSLFPVDEERQLELEENAGSGSNEKRAQTSSIAKQTIEPSASGVGLISSNQVLSRAARDRALTHGSARELRRETSPSPHTLWHALLNVENAIMDVKNRQDRNERRTRSEHAQQFLQIHQGMEDIKGHFQTMRREMQSVDAQAHSALSLRTSVQKGYASLSIEIKHLYVHLKISTLWKLIRY